MTLFRMVFVILSMFVSMMAFLLSESTGPSEKLTAVCGLVIGIGFWVEVLVLLCYQTVSSLCKK